jgi:membrane protein implicated in regulation of membrane protease activity
MRPFFAAGLGFIVLGGLTVCFGGKGTGFVLMGLGVATTATGVLFVQYPWAVLLLALIAGALAAIAAWDRLRARRELDRNREALEATAAVIQNRPEGKAIKKGLAELGNDVETCIRAVIDPIKAKLRQEGKIE